MRYTLIPLWMCLLLLLACSRSGRGEDWSEKLRRFTPGADASSLVDELQKADYPSRISPGYPSGENHAIYFLPDGDVHLSTQAGASNQLAIMSAPFYVQTGKSVETRVRIWEGQFLPHE